MKKRFTFLTGILAMFALFGGPSCNRTAEENDTVVKIESEDFTGSSAETAVQTLESGERVVDIPGGEWISFDVPVKEAGRYRTVVRASCAGEGEATLWLEDYCDNADGRTYNITGSMDLSGEESPERLVTLVRDGSPLNEGIHSMKLHVEKGGARVDWISFELIRAHEVTPLVLTQNMEGDEWVVVWSDEFDTDGMLDTTKWTYDIGDWGWGNNELQYYTVGRKENARIENGNLIIEARKNDMGYKWTSARITTRWKTCFLYGRIEFRAMVPARRGNWAAGWTLGDSYVDEMSWPYCGEVDIMESVGFEIDDETGDGTAHASIHCGAYYFKKNNARSSTTGVSRMSGQFHTYAVEWTPEYIKAFVDDKHYFTYDEPSDPLTWPFNEPQNIILNLAMGGGWGGARGLDQNMTSQQIIIDYVRVYGKQ